MRYLNADDVTFTDASGKTVTLKDQLPNVPKAVSFLKVECDKETSLDEIASRDNMYGAGAEGSAYKIFDENVVELVDVGFDPGKLLTLRVPT